LSRLIFRAGRPVLFQIAVVGLGALTILLTVIALFMH
jgi:hypothetical protein